MHGMSQLISDTDRTSRLVWFGIYMLKRLTRRHDSKQTLAACPFLPGLRGWVRKNRAAHYSDLWFRYMGLLPIYSLGPVARTA
jgi:hypothetical protein